MLRPARPKADRAAHPLIAGLEPEAAALLKRHLRRGEKRRGDLLASAGHSIQTVFFVSDGLVALFGRAPDGGTAATGLVGPGGFVGVSAALSAHHPAVRDAVALTSVQAQAIDAEALDRIATLHPDLRRRLMLYANDRIIQATQLCVCTALHTVEQRLARWLLEAYALRRDRPIELTHQQLSDLLGVRRASVTLGLHMLEGEQAVRCQRGRIEIRDLDALGRRSCGCHLAVAGESQRAYPALSSASSTDSPRD